MIKFLYRRWLAKRAEAEDSAKWHYSLRSGKSSRRVNFFRIASLPTIRKEDLMYLRINSLDGTLTTSTEENTP